MRITRELREKVRRIAEGIGREVYESYGGELERMPLARIISAIAQRCEARLRKESEFLFLDRRQQRVLTEFCISEASKALAESVVGTLRKPFPA